MSEKKNEQNDDFLDFSTIKEEINDGPSEEEFTRAMDQMSKTDRDILKIQGLFILIVTCLQKHRQCMSFPYRSRMKKEKEKLYPSLFASC